MRIVLTGGGSGGHLIPFEPLIESLRTVYLEQRSALPASVEPGQLEIRFVGAADEKAREFFRNYDVAATPVASGKLRRYVSHLTVLDLLVRLPVGIIQALYVLWQIMPDVVISKGGYGAIPVLVAAVVYRIPFLLHESDAVVGLANRFSARFAAAIAVGFAATAANMKQFGYKTFVTGIPVRARFGQIPPENAKQSFGLPAADKVVLVIGGSQGAAQLNEVLLQVLPELVLEAAVIHITGEAHYTKFTSVAQALLESSSRAARYKAYPYLSETVIEAMTAADVVVSRAGATTLAELTRLRKPTLIIPLPSAANDHQRRNAEIYERARAARVLDPSNLGKNLFLRSVQELLHSEPLRAELVSNMARLDHPAAARQITDLAFKLAAGLVPSTSA